MGKLTAPCQKCLQWWPKHLIIRIRGPFDEIAWLDPICALKKLRVILVKPHLAFSGENKQKYDEAMAILSDEQARSPTGA